jgi:hypothetical protein
MPKVNDPDLPAQLETRRVPLANVADALRRSKPRGSRSGFRNKAWLKALSAAFAAVYVLPIVLAAALILLRGPGEHWSRADRSSAGIAPDAKRTPQAVIQLYNAPTYGWRGAFGAHSWIAVKPSGSLFWERFEVVGFGVSRGRPAIRSGRGIPDGKWYGNNPVLLADLRGEAAETAITRIRIAAAAYPYPNTYTVWPGPNSNTFIAYLLRRVPELRADLPANAIGKDYPVDGMLSRTPSGTGWQFSVLGMAGLSVGKEEGFELNLLGLGAGLDFFPPALRLPGIGRVGLRP